MPKALVTLEGEPLVTHAVRRIIAAGGVSHVVVVAPVTHEAQFADALVEFIAPGERAEPDTARLTIVGGGGERSDSVRAGLAALDADCDLVLVHDAARALAPPSLMRRVMSALEAGADAVIPGVAVVDTIKVVDVGAEATTVVATPERSTLRAVQTPQGFRRGALSAAHESGLDATDDAALVERAGGAVVVVEGDEMALKVTTPLDMLIAAHLLTAGERGTRGS